MDDIANDLGLIDDKTYRVGKEELRVWMQDLLHATVHISVCLLKGVPFIICLAVFFLIEISNLYFLG